MVRLPPPPCLTSSCSKRASPPQIPLKVSTLEVASDLLASYALPRPSPLSFKGPASCDAESGARAESLQSKLSLCPHQLCGQGHVTWPLSLLGFLTWEVKIKVTLSSRDGCEDAQRPAHSKLTGNASCCSATMATAWLPLRPVPHCHHRLFSSGPSWLFHQDSCRSFKTDASASVPVEPSFP